MTNNILIFLILSTTVVGACAQRTTCSEGFKKIVGSCYKFIKVGDGRATFSQANDACRNMNASLATIRCKEQNDKILELFRSIEDTPPFQGRTALSRYPYSSQFFIGLVGVVGRYPESGNFVNDRQHNPYAYRNWGIGEPNIEMGHENVTQFIIEDIKGEPGAWNNIREDEEQWGAICEQITETSEDGCERKSGLNSILNSI